MTDETMDPKAVVSDLMAQKKQNATDLKEAKAAVREASKNVKAAEKYRKALADEDENIPAADEALTGWQTALAERERNVADLEASAEDIKTKLADAREAAKAKPAKEKTPRVEQNGQAQPKEGTKTRRVWDIADEVSATKGTPAAFEEVWEKAKSEELVKATVQTQYAAWRRFHGIEGRVKSAAKIEAEKAAAAEPAPAPAE